MKLKIITQRNKYLTLTSNIIKLFRRGGNSKTSTDFQSSNESCLAKKDAKPLFQFSKFFTRNKIRMENSTA